MGVTGVNRRNALGIGAAGIAALNFGSFPARAADGFLKAVVTIGGRSYEFREEAGQDLGDYTSMSGHFTQRCVRCEVADFPLSVFFRPDRNSDRAEVVFELGRVFSTSPANLGAYSVVISRGEQTLARIDVPEHYWFSRWRWQSAPRPVMADIDKLMQYGLLPLYERETTGSGQAANLNLVPLPNGDYVDLSVVGEFTSGNYANAGNLVMNSDAYRELTSGAGTATANLSVAGSTYTVMSLAGVQAFMPRTGERDDIGPVTEAQAKYITTSDQGALELLLSQAEAAGTMPWHIRDDRQNGPFDFRAYPNATWYGRDSGHAPYIQRTETPITIDSAHQPALAYVPYLLTEDPYFLEELQFQATWNWGSLPPGYRPSGEQPRLLAWNLRTLAQVTRVSQTVTPAWLLPYSYWAEQLNQHRVWFEQNYVYSTRPERQIFHSAGVLDNGRDEARAPAGTWVDPWQDEFLATILGWVNYMGFSDWKPAFQWAAAGTIARTNGTSGWVRAWCTPYRIILRRSSTAPVAASWAEAWELTKSITGTDYTDPNTFADQDMNYLAYSRGTLTYAVNLGIAEAAEPLRWATEQITKRGWRIAAKWRLGSDL
jgi:hypothetical protein